MTKKPVKIQRQAKLEFFRQIDWMKVTFLTSEFTKTNRFRTFSVKSIWISTMQITCKMKFQFLVKTREKFRQISYFFVVGGKNELRLEPVGVALAVADLLVENCLGVNIVKSKNFVKILLFFATKSCFFFCFDFENRV